MRHHRAGLAPRRHDGGCQHVSKPAVPPVPANGPHRPVRRPEPDLDARLSSASPKPRGKAEQRRTRREFLGDVARVAAAGALAGRGHAPPRRHALRARALAVGPERARELHLQPAGYFTTMEGWLGEPAGNLAFAGEHTDSFHNFQVSSKAPHSRVRAPPSTCSSASGQGTYRHLQRVFALRVYQPSARGASNGPPPFFVTTGCSRCPASGRRSSTGHRPRA